MDVRTWSCNATTVRPGHTLIPGAASLILAAAFAHAGSVSTTQCVDTFLNSMHPDNNNGGDTTFFTGRGGEGGIMRALIRCDLPSAVDERMSISQVKLTLTTAGLGPTGSSGGTAATESLNAVTQAWGEGNKTGTTTTTYTVGQACTAGEATWNQRLCTTANWTTAGGTVSAASSATASSPTSIGSPVVFASSSGGMINDVLNWIANPSLNFGWRLASSTEGTLGQAQRFVSSEGGSGSPALTITYSCKAGFDDTGSGCTACTLAAQTACVTSQSGNVCSDPGAPSGYSCVCGNPAYTGTGTQSCTDRNECIPNHCMDLGDVGAACTDHVAPATGYGCSCDAGFVFDGTSCSDRIFAGDFEGI